MLAGWSCSELGEARPDVDTRVYFGRVAVVIVESSALESEILTQILTGFRARRVHSYTNTAQALERLHLEGADLLMVGHCPPAEGRLDEYDFIRQVRRSKAEATRMAPIILLAGHTLESNVLRARDCGASFVIAKPVTPAVLYDRIGWLARDARGFISTATYAGPDRRFQKLGPPRGTEGRRRDDLSLKVGEARAPNMSQAEIDALLNGKGALR